MSVENFYTVIVTLITVLGSAGAWQFYSKKLEKKRTDELEYKYECKTRIDKLEFLLAESSKEKEELRNLVLELSTELASLRTKIELMEKERGII